MHPASVDTMNYVRKKFRLFPPSLPMETSAGRGLHRMKFQPFLYCFPNPTIILKNFVSVVILSLHIILQCPRLSKNKYVKNFPYPRFPSSYFPNSLLYMIAKFLCFFLTFYHKHKKHARIMESSFSCTCQLVPQMITFYICLFSFILFILYSYHLHNFPNNDFLVSSLSSCIC